LGYAGEIDGDAGQRLRRQGAPGEQDFQTQGHALFVYINVNVLPDGQCIVNIARAKLDIYRIGLGNAYFANAELFDGDLLALSQRPALH